MAEADGSGARGRLAKAFGGNVEAIRAEIQRSTRQELMDRYGLSYGGVEYNAKRYGSRPLGKSARRGPCTDCGAGRSEAQFNRGRNQCRRCEAARRGTLVNCERCGADVYGQHRQKWCQECSDAELARRKRGVEAWQRQGAPGTLSAWLRGEGARLRCKCPLWTALETVQQRIRRQVRITPLVLTDEERRAKVRRRFRERYRSDPEFAARQRLRAHARKHNIWGCIGSRVRGGAARPNATGGRLFEFLGYTPADLKKHLRRQFTKTMTWEAFLDGRIHIDHVRPVSSFDLSTDGGIKECWSLANLRPCWARENLRKAARLEFLI